MKIFFYDELMKMSIDELLDLLSSYIELRNDICYLINSEPMMKEYYIENNLYFYLLNIAKIKGTIKHILENPD